jgi:hypothetical protein
MKDWLTDPEPKQPLVMQVLDAISAVCCVIGKLIVFILFGAWL